MVTDDPHVIFYAGVPLVSDNGLPLGTLCVIDHKPKLLSQGQLHSLKALGNTIMSLLNLRKTKSSLDKALLNLEEKNYELERFAFVAAHDLRSPLIGISGLSELLSETYSSQIDTEGQEMLSLISNSSDKLKNLIDGLLEYSRCDSILQEKKSHINLKNLVEEINGLFSFEHNLKINLITSATKIITNKAALDQILINLVTNAVKYNDKETIEIQIGVASTPSHYEFYIQDNGPGIPLEDQKHIFEIFKILQSQDRFGRPGNGIGLATVKKIVTNSGGTITVKSKPGKGAKFLFTIEK